MTTPIEDRVAALEQTVAQLTQAGKTMAQRITTLETQGSALDTRVTRIVNVLKRVGPAVRDIISLVSTQAANRDAILPEDERVERARTREEVLNSDFTINGS